MKSKLMNTTLLTSVLLALLFVTAGHASAQQFDMISNVTLEADNDDYVGPCPKDMHLKGQFQVNQASLGIGSYQVIRLDGDGNAVPISLNDKGTRTVDVRFRQTNTWSNQVYLRVTVSLPSGPKQFDSGRIAIKGECRRVVPEVGPAAPPATGRFRVTLTGFVVNHETLEGPFSTDGAGDEVFALVNFAELGPSGNVSGPLETRMSVRYGDTSGIGPNTLPGIFQGGEASRTGGFRSGNPYPPRAGQPVTPSRLRAETRARLIPMILWEGELRRGGPNPNGAVLVPTIWESDNTPDVLNIWNRQVDDYLRRFAATSRRFVTDAASRPLVERVDTVLSTPPQLIDFDRPIGIQGDTFNP